MIVSAKLNAAINAQIGHELENSNRYIAIASYFEGECLFGLAKIYFKQAEEEREHAMKFVKFLLEVGGKVAIPQIPAPANEFATAEDAHSWRSIRKCVQPRKSTHSSSWRQPRKTISPSIPSVVRSRAA